MTQQLTAEKARELRDVITKNAAVIEPTIRDLYIVQALDLALLVLEAQRFADIAGCGFVVCRPHGEPAQVADPSKVHLSFIDAGLGHGD